MNDYDIKRLKSVGLMKQKEKDLFSLRLRVVGGMITSEQLAGLAEIARKYGKSYLHLTTRQGVEIPNVEFKDIEKLKGELAKAGLEPGAGGHKLRTVTACQGAECSHGLIDCFALAKEIEREYFGIDGYPHKFKIGITGCINSCIKPQENDLGIMGRFHNGHKGYVIFVGGKMGRSPKFGVKAFDFIETEERLLGIVKKTLEFYKKFGIEGERFGDTLERVGIEKYKEEALKG
ncbi:MAG: coenzyme F420 hydrogenase [Candidatus Omnitrophota bacterium]